MDGNDLMPKLRVRHKGNNRPYCVDSLAKLKIDKVWIDVVIYRPLYLIDPGFDVCVRPIVDFLNNFEEM